MFTSEYQQNTSFPLIKNYNGVDLTNFNCHKLERKQLFDQYSLNQIHYVVDAVQKGLNPHSQKRIKKLQQKKNKQKLQRFTRRSRTEDIKKPKPNVPKSPESICMKALRSEFLEKFQQKQQTHTTRSPRRDKQKIKSPKIIRKKLNQRIRRDQLRRLVKKYKPVLDLHFGDRMKGYKGYPKVSRQQIKEYLISIGITPDLGQVKFDPEVVKLIALILPKQDELILGKAFGIKNSC